MALSIAVPTRDAATGRRPRSHCRYRRIRPQALQRRRFKGTPNLILYRSTHIKVFKRYRLWIKRNSAAGFIVARNAQPEWNCTPPQTKKKTGRFSFISAEIPCKSAVICSFHTQRADNSRPQLIASRSKMARMARFVIQNIPVMPIDISGYHLPRCEVFL